MKKIIVEVGSTNTKIDCYDGTNVINLETINIEFKKNYIKNKCVSDEDLITLANKINELKKESNDIFVCGTSIFRNLSDEERKLFQKRFKDLTKIDFNIITSDEENELTVSGAVENVNQKVAVMIGGGGSTEISIYDNGIKEMVNSNIGVIDVMEKFPDLAEDVASTDLEVVKSYVRRNMNFSKENADVLILAGGAHKYFALESGISYEDNTLYHDKLQPIMMKVKQRSEDTNKYYKEISLDKIRSRVDEPKWWYATRAMCAFALVVAEEIGAKYVVPTDISMVYGIIGGKTENY